LRIKEDEEIASTRAKYKKMVNDVRNTHRFIQQKFDIELEKLKNMRQALESISESNRLFRAMNKDKIAEDRDTIRSHEESIKEIVIPQTVAMEANDKDEW
jgi:hypothetical protein